MQGEAMIDPHNQSWWGSELSPAYCDVIVKRWETATGKKAKLCRK